MTAGEAFPRRARVNRDREIRALRRRGRRYRSGPLDLYVASSPAGRARVGLVVARHGRTIADRNRLKRRLRELARREWLPGAREGGLEADLLIQARAEAYDESFDELRTALREGLRTVEWPGGSSSR